MLSRYVTEDDTSLSTHRLPMNIREVTGAKDIGTYSSFLVISGLGFLCSTSTLRKSFMKPWHGEGTFFLRPE